MNTKTSEFKLDTSIPALAVVTGSAGGIGRQIALDLGTAGYFVVVTDIDSNAIDETLAQLQANGSVGIGVQTDVSCEASVQDLFFKIATIELSGFAMAESEAAGESRVPFLLVNNAGIQTWSSLLELELADWKRTLAVNLDGCFLMTREFSRYAIKHKHAAAIINIGSGCNKLAFPQLVDYSASKGGVEMLTKSAALELGPYGIKVNCIAPGAIETDRTSSETSDYSTAWSELTPLKRVGNTKDVSNAVLMLTSPVAGFISGQTINVDGALFSSAPWPREY